MVHWLCKNITAEGYCVHHLHQVNEDCHNKWKYPSEKDIHTAEFEQIVNCVVHAEIFCSSKH